MPELLGRQAGVTGKRLGDFQRLFAVTFLQFQRSQRAGEAGVLGVQTDPPVQVPTAFVAFAANLGDLGREQQDLGIIRTRDAGRIGDRRGGFLRVAPAAVILGHGELDGGSLPGGLDHAIDGQVGKDRGVQRTAQQAREFQRNVKQGGIGRDRLAIPFFRLVKLSLGHLDPGLLPHQFGILQAKGTHLGNAAAGFLEFPQEDRQRNQFPSKFVAGRITLHGLVEGHVGLLLLASGLRQRIDQQGMTAPGVGVGGIESKVAFQIVGGLLGFARLLEADRLGQHVLRAAFHLMGVQKVRGRSGHDDDARQDRGKAVIDLFSGTHDSGFRWASQRAGKRAVRAAGRKTVRNSFNAGSSAPCGPRPDNGRMT